MAPTSAPQGLLRRWKTAALAGLLLCLICCLNTTFSAQAAPIAQSWTWPLTPPPAIVRGFDPPEQPWLPGHRGVDLAAPTGSKIRAPAAGTVSFVGWVVNRKVITIDHGRRLKSSFEPVESNLSVGASVVQGEVIGLLSRSPHCAARSCLHWGVRRGEEYLNPLLFLGDRRPSVLLPIDTKQLS